MRILHITFDRIHITFIIMVNSITFVIMIMSIHNTNLIIIIMRILIRYLNGDLNGDFMRPHVGGLQH